MREDGGRGMVCLLALAWRAGGTRRRWRRCGGFPVELGDRGLVDQSGDGARRGGEGGAAIHLRTDLAVEGKRAAPLHWISRELRGGAVEERRARGGGRHGGLAASGEPVRHGGMLAGRRRWE